MLPIFDQIQAGLMLAFSDFTFIFFALAIIGIILLVAAGWTAPLAMILIGGAVLMTSWAGYTTYGLTGLVVIIIAYLFTAIAFALVRR